MSKTLFIYIFRDLLKVFFVASGVLAGIMSFGGLLRPLTREQLDTSQVIQMLAYFMPAMTSYSLPVAALFAATIIYGRLSADNELTACRAAGISALSINTPGIVLGLLASLVSLGFLSYLVPVYSLKVEKVVYANVARFIAGQVQRNRQIQLGGFTVFAQEATIGPTEESGRQSVVLHSPMIVQYDRRGEGPPVPREFYLARTATAYISQDPGGETFTLEAVLDGGVKVPRSARGGVQAGIEATSFRSEPMPSLLREQVRFMTVDELHRLHSDPSSGRRVRAVQRQLAERVVRQTALQRIGQSLEESGRMDFVAVDQVRYELIRGPASLSSKGYVLTLAATGRGARVELVEHAGAGDPVRVAARTARLSVMPDMANATLAVSVDLDEAEIHPGDTEAVPRERLVRGFTIAMSPWERRVLDMPATDMQAMGLLTDDEQKRLGRELLVTANSVIAEAHARMAFSVSCFALVWLGCSLGSMFRSGNFLGAFALCFIPALACIALINMGQQHAQGIPRDLAHLVNPLNAGLAMIWSGNVVVLGAAVYLQWKLLRA